VLDAGSNGARRGLERCSTVLDAGSTAVATDEVEPAVLFAVAHGDGPEGPEVVAGDARRER
jgi:hypothetical protein